MQNVPDSVIFNFPFSIINCYFIAVENLLDLLFGQVFIVVVVHLHHRRGAAGGQTFHFGQRESAIRGGLSAFDAKFLLEKRRHFLGAAQRAGKRAANLNMMAPDRLHVVHGVKTHHAMDPRRRLVHQLGDIFDRLRPEMTELLLRQIKHRQHRRFLLRIARDRRFELLQRLR